MELELEEPFISVLLSLLRHVISHTAYCNTGTYIRTGRPLQGAKHINKGAARGEEVLHLVVEVGLSKEQ